MVVVRGSGGLCWAQYIYIHTHTPTHIYNMYVIDFVYRYRVFVCVSYTILIPVFPVCIDKET